MARIPLAEIPNANFQLPEATPIRMSAFQVNTAPVAQMLRQDNLDASPFLASAGAGVQIGQAIGEAGGIFGRLADKLANSKNQADLSRAEGVMAQTVEAFALDRENNSETEWAALWKKKFRPQMVKNLEGLGLSQAVWAQLSPQMARFEARLQTGLAHEANVRKIGRDYQAIDAGITRDIGQANFAGARTGVDRLEAADHITPEKARERRAQIDASETDYHLNARMNFDPESFAVEVEAQRIDVPAQDRTLWLDRARELSLMRRRAARENLDSRIMDRQVSTPEQARGEAEAARLSEREVESYQRALSVPEPRTVAERHVLQQSFDSLWQRALKYDREDDVDGELAAQLQIEIRESLPSSRRQALLDNLYAGMNEGLTPQRQSQAELAARIDILGQYGLLVPRGGANADADAYERELGKKTARLKQGLRDFYQSHPHATPAEAFAWLDTETEDDFKKAAASVLPVRRWSTP